MRLRKSTVLSTAYGTTVESQESDRHTFARRALHSFKCGRLLFPDRRQTVHLFSTPAVYLVGRRRPVTG